jgi:hypothetical protein
MYLTKDRAAFERKDLGVCEPTIGSIDGLGDLVLRCGCVFFLRGSVGRCRNDRNWKRSFLNIDID